MTSAANEGLVFIPTYNECENIRPLFERIRQLNLGFDFLLLDDSSPDGTGRIMDELRATYPGVHVIHRSGKLGIGSAHRDAIHWAYDHGYKTLLTMDADFTHTPEAIPLLLAKSLNHNVVVASRYLKQDSLLGWNLFRRFLTTFGHLLTVLLLDLRQDATGAFRVYRLDQIPRAFLDLVRSNGYSFFFESLYVLNRNRFSIAEVPNALPPRTYGSSKMDVREIFRSLHQLCSLTFERVAFPGSRLLNQTHTSHSGVSTHELGVH